MYKVEIAANEVAGTNDAAAVHHPVVLSTMDALMLPITWLGMTKALMRTLKFVKFGCLHAENAFRMALTVSQHWSADPDAALE